MLTTEIITINYKQFYEKKNKDTNINNHCINKPCPVPTLLREKYWLESDETDPKAAKTTKKSLKH